MKTNEIRSKLNLSPEQFSEALKQAGLQAKPEYSAADIRKIEAAAKAAPTPRNEPSKPNPKTQTGELAKAAQARTAAIAHQIEALERRDDALCTQVGVKLAEMVQARPAKIEAAFNQAMEGYTFDWDEFLGVQHLETAVEHFRLPSSSTVDCLPAGTEG